MTIAKKAKNQPAGVVPDQFNNEFFVRDGEERSTNAHPIDYRVPALREVPRRVMHSGESLVPQQTSRKGR